MDEILKNKKISDFYIENLKIRLGIIEKKPERIRKSAQKVNQENLTES